MQVVTSWPWPQPPFSIPCIRVEFVLFHVSSGSCSHSVPEMGTARHLLGTVPCWPPRWKLFLYSPITGLVSDSSDYVVCPWSALLSATGSLSFQGHVSHIEAAPFKAPELLQGQSEDEQPDASQVSCAASLQLLSPVPWKRPVPVAASPAPSSALQSLVLNTKAEWVSRVLFPGCLVSNLLAHGQGQVHLSEPQFLHW